MSRAARPDPHVFIALLAGGRGTRFWPLSRHARPKQLLDIAGAGPMLRATHERVEGLCPPRNVLLVTTEDLVGPSRRLLKLRSQDIIAEPSGRNTAPAIGLAALIAFARDPEAVVLALPADHHVARPSGLIALLRRAIAEARRTRGIVLFGAPPDRPETGYGYLILGKSAKGLRRVVRFREKPTEPVARRLMREGALWNTGMSCFRAVDVLREIASCLPDLHARLEALRPHVGKRSFQAALRREHARMPAISFDHGVLERSRNVHALAADVGWSDLGTWESLGEVVTPDARGNVTQGDVLLEGAARCVVIARGGPQRRLVVLGCEDLVLIDAGDVVLACPRGRARDVASLMARLRSDHPELL